MHRIRDFEVLYNICEGSFTSHKSNFNPKQEVDLVKESLKDELLRREIKLELTADANMAEVVQANQQIFRQTCMNALLSAASGLERTTLKMSLS